MAYRNAFRRLRIIYIGKSVNTFTWPSPKAARRPVTELGKYLTSPESQFSALTSVALCLGFSYSVSISKHLMFWQWLCSVYCSFLCCSGIVISMKIDSFHTIMLLLREWLAFRNCFFHSGLSQFMHEKLGIGKYLQSMFPAKIMI